MMLSFDPDDVRAFVVAVYALTNDPIKASEVAPVDFAKITRGMIAEPPEQQRLTVELLGAHCGDEQWAACARVLRSLAQSPLFGQFTSVVGAVDSLRKNAEWCAALHSALCAAQAHVEHEERLAKGGKLS